MLANLYLALSNFPAVYPISRAHRHGDYTTAGIIFFVSVASFVSHLAENHKHGMPGIGLSQRVSYILNRFDVLGCVLVGCRLAQLYLSKYGLSMAVAMDKKLKFLAMCLPFVLLRISEYDKYNPTLKPLYIATHPIWHASIFMAMDRFLLDFIYD